MVKLSLRIRSWVYELGGVLGISLATNLLATAVATPSPELRTWHYSIVVWLVFGIASLYYAHKLREQENIWEREKQKSECKNVTEWTQSELQKLKRIKLALGTITLSFIAAAILLCQSVLAPKQSQRPDAAPPVPAKPAS